MVLGHFSVRVLQFSPFSIIPPSSIYSYFMFYFSIVYHQYSMIVAIVSVLKYTTCFPLDLRLGGIQSLFGCGREQKSFMDRCEAFTLTPSYKDAETLSVWCLKWSGSISKRPSVACDPTGIKYLWSCRPMRAALQESDEDAWGSRPSVCLFCIPHCRRSGSWESKNLCRISSHTVSVPISFFTSNCE